MWKQNKLRNALIPGLCFVLMSLFTKGQNLFDCQHSLIYANYLFSTQDYERAANEYERILFSCDTLPVRQQLLRAYRLAGRYPQSFRQLNRLYPQPQTTPDFARQEYLKLFLLTGQYNRIDSLLATGLVSADTARLFRLKTNLLTNQWSAATQQLAQMDSTQLPNWKEYHQLLDRAQQFKPKKPAVAAALSTVVPGLGKIYTRDRKDGIISFLFVGSLAYQAYRAFHRRGPDSVAGWLFTGVGIGFHLGNIYGSAKSARLFNQRRLQQLNNEARRISFRDL